MRHGKDGATAVTLVCVYVELIVLGHIVDGSYKTNACRRKTNPQATKNKHKGIFMNTQAFFAGLVFDEAGELVQTAMIGSDPQYVINDDGFLHHVNAASIDREVLRVFVEQLQANREIAVEQTLNMLGKDDIFTKAALDASLRNVNVEQLIAQGLPQQARDMMALLGFRIIINYHGEVVRLEQPAVASDEGD